MRNLSIFITVLISSICISCSSEGDGSFFEPNDDGAPAYLEAETKTNVSYGSDAQQVYDLYLPAGRKRDVTKVIVLIHGGGWIEGDKSDMSEFVELIKTNLPGYAIVNMNYVLADLQTPAFPNQFLDVKSVISKIKSESASLQINPEFALIGTSAGAHLSLMYDYAFDGADDVKMVADIVGPTDFTDPFYTNDPQFETLLGLLIDEAAYPQGTDYAQAVSPLFQLSASASPTIMFYGNQDPLVPLTNGESLAEALAQAQIDYSFTVYEGGHGDDWSAADRTDLQEKLTNFIETNLPIPIQ